MECESLIYEPQVARVWWHVVAGRAHLHDQPVHDLLLGVLQAYFPSPSARTALASNSRITRRWNTCAARSDFLMSFALSRYPWTLSLYSLSSVISDREP